MVIKYKSQRVGFDNREMKTGKNREIGPFPGFGFPGFWSGKNREIFSVVKYIHSYTKESFFWIFRGFEL